MRYRVLVGCGASLFACSAIAQSNVQIYGVIDTSIRYTTNNPTSNGPETKIAMPDGAFNGPRIGFKGSEDLGSGSKAFFTLENGFGLSKGTLGQQGQLFGRQAFVGLSNSGFGTVKLGRQYGAAYFAMALVDPIGTGNYSENVWQSSLTGIRFDNTIDYSNKWGAFGLEAQYSLGEQAGNTSSGRSMQLAIDYAIGSGKVTAGLLQSKDSGNRAVDVWTVGGMYKAGNLTGYLYTIQSRRDAGFAIGASGAGQPLSNTSIGGNANTVLGAGTQKVERKDREFTVGLTYQATPSINLIGAYMRDSVSGVAPNVDGTIQTFYAIVNYAFSKRTDVYLELDRTRLSDGSVTDPNGPIGNFGGASNRTGVAVGLRHRF